MVELLRLNLTDCTEFLELLDEDGADRPSMANGNFVNDGAFKAWITRHSAKYNQIHIHLEKTQNEFF
jgi:hypothetical protein